MKKTILTFLLFLIFPSLYSQEKFIIGVFNEPEPKSLYTQYSNSGKIGTANIAELNTFNNLKNAKINLLLGQTIYSWNYDYYRLLIDKILIPLEYSPNVVISGKSFTHPYLNKKFNDNSLKIYLNFLQEYTKQGYTNIINLGDEPAPDDTWAFDNNQYIKKNYTNFKTFINLLPIYYPGFNNSIIAYKSYLNQYKNSTPHFDKIAFDYFPYTYNKTSEKNNTNTDGNLYYINLALMKSTFSSLGFLSYIGCNKVDGVRAPNNYELNKSIFCPLAYGTKGILYFDKLPDVSSNLYNQIRSLNKYITNVIGPVIMESTCQTFHSNYDKTDSDDPNLTILDHNSIIKSVNKNDILFAVFTTNNIDKNKLENDKKYLLIVNKSLTKQTNISIKLKGDFHNLIHLFPHYSNFDENISLKLSDPTGTSYSSGLTEFTIDYLEGGEGILVKI